jgi:hypothetical protein
VSVPGAVSDRSASSVEIWRIDLEHGNIARLDSDELRLRERLDREAVRLPVLALDATGAARDLNPGLEPRQSLGASHRGYPPVGCE